MTEQVHSKRVKILNEDGFHLRPADSFVSVAKRFTAEVSLVKDDVRVDGKSILSIMTLAASHGSEITIQAVGADADEAVRELAELVERKFDLDGPSSAEDRQQTGV